MKKILVLLSCFTLVIFLTACSDTNEDISNTQKAKETIKKIDKETGYNIYWNWKCTGDVTYEQHEEERILAVENENFDGTILKAGTYKVKYSFEEYDSVTSSKRFNRIYSIIVTDELHDTVNDVVDGKSYVYSPDYYEDKEITLEKGKYVYISHTPSKQALDGDLTLILKQ